MSEAAEITIKGLDLAVGTYLLVMSGMPFLLLWGHSSSQYAGYC